MLLLDQHRGYSVDEIRKGTRYASPYQANVRKDSRWDDDNSFIALIAGKDIRAESYYYRLLLICLDAGFISNLGSLLCLYRRHDFVQSNALCAEKRWLAADH